MTECDHCGVGLEVARECPYCENALCPDHRLPEAHDCTGVEGWERRGKRFDSGFDGFDDEE
jgi:predicted nucleic acid binding AN1-type Zn finger protein